MGKIAEYFFYPQKVNVSKNSCASRSQNWLPGTKLGSKISYPEQNWDPKLVTRNKPGSQNWLPGTNIGSKIGYPEQTWDPKLVTRNKPGIQNWLPEGCQEKFIICVWKVFGWCPDGVNMLYWWCLDHVWTLSEPCLDIVRTMSGWCLDYVWTVSGRCLEHKICLESFWTSLKCVWMCLKLVWMVLDSVWSMSTPCMDRILNLFGLWLEHVWMVSMSRPWTVYEPLSTLLV